MPLNTKTHILERAPKTAGDLRAYNDYVFVWQQSLPSLAGKVTDGKVNPSRYNSTSTKDLGLCYETYFTNKACRYGSQCRWRHARLKEEERRWLRELGATEVVAFMDSMWAEPFVPESTPWFPPYMFTT